MAGVETLLWVLTQLGRLIDFYQLTGSEHTHTHRILSFLRYTLLGQRLLQTLNCYLNRCYPDKHQQWTLVDSCDQLAVANSVAFVINWQ